MQMSHYLYGFYISEVVQDFFHQEQHLKMMVGRRDLVPFGLGTFLAGAWLLVSSVKPALMFPHVRWKTLRYTYIFT